MKFSTLGLSKIIPFFQMRVGMITDGFTSGTTGRCFAEISERWSKDFDRQAHRKVSATDYSNIQVEK